MKLRSVNAAKHLNINFLQQFAGFVLRGAIASTCGSFMHKALVRAIYPLPTIFLSYTKGVILFDIKLSKSRSFKPKILQLHI